MVKHAVRRTAIAAKWCLFPRVMEKKASNTFYSEIAKVGVAFIHIPKAAGMSLSHSIYGAQIGHMKWHHLRDINPRVYDDLLKFAVCRNPEDRFCSAFAFLKQGGINRSDETFSKRILSEFDTAEDLALALEDLKLRKKIQRKIHFQSQHSFVCNKSNIIMVDHLIDLKRLHDDATKLLSPYGIQSIPHINKTKGQHSHLPQLSARSQAILKKVYTMDYELMNYTLGQRSVRGMKVRGQQEW